MAQLSHFDDHNEAMMVDISEKKQSERFACFEGKVQLSKTAKKIIFLKSEISEISSVGRTAGILAAKQCHHLIPHCHQIPLAKVEVQIKYENKAKEFLIKSTAKSAGKTGVEMEALVAASIAAATVYDMIKAIDPLAILGPFSLTEKTGGKTTIKKTSMKTRSKKASWND